MFSFGFGMASVAKAQQKMSNHCTSKSRNLELYFTMYVFFACCQLELSIILESIAEFSSPC